jgi:hypothetical protein
MLARQTDTCAELILAAQEAAEDEMADLARAYLARGLGAFFASNVRAGFSLDRLRQILADIERSH